MTTPAPLSPFIIEPLVRMALCEDLGRAGDITSDSTVPDTARACVVIAAREDGRIAGMDIAEAAFRMVDGNLKITRLIREGADVKKGDEVMQVEGRARSILTAERVALNFMGHMSGVATLTLKMVRAVGNHKAKIAATRKTLPGLRAVQKYAVMVGGGIPHRYGLDDAVLIKDNHIAMAGGVRNAIRGAKAHIGHTVKIEVEVDTLEQLAEVLDEGVDIVMLDNMTNEQMKKAVAMAAGRAVVEASGGVTLARIPEIAATGVDLISSGAITHSAPNFDVGLDYKAAA
ncbi:MAG: carboxylating nicotinate-nucleotide diphosphorylase [Parvibaculum sp.]|uniref:carboxylating nicotinate-nucleotide diphosphorylase n=1 Tax=Parvibaculum sp. TaxID=2024848 RepID=UPI0027312F93|nr:carboxylating nicotinate-nucleotide diphosphorylase [Parvibaculum sp.]MDP2148827.1 carboxylating nicotinate-nucleotide diphosphorylase [Parvibaculum sp.]